MPNPIIRSMVPSDYTQWRVLWDGYNEFYGRSGPMALSDTVTAVTWARFFDGYEPMNALVAEVEGRLIGLVQYLFHRSTISIGPVCYLQDLFTVPEARGQGIGRALIEAVYERAQHAGASRVYWHTHETNVTAQALYDRLAERSGFIVYRHQMPNQ